MFKTVGVVAALIVGLIGGCATSDDFTLPPGVLGYSSIDTSVNNDTSPQVAFDGTNYLVVYEFAFSDTDHDIIGTLVSPGGVVVSTFDIDPSAHDDHLPKVAFDGRNYLVVYQRTAGSANRDIIGALVATSGAVLTGSPFNIDASANDDLIPAVAYNYNSINYLVVYQRTNGSSHDIVGVLVGTAGLAGSSFNIDSSPNDDLAPEVATVPIAILDDPFYLVVYQRTVSATNHDIIGAVVDGDTGTVPPGSPFNIDISANDDSAPAVAFGGGSYLVAYQRTVSSTNRDIIGVSANEVSGTVTVGTPFAIDGSPNDDLAPGVASDGTNYLVAYQRTAGSSSHNIIGTRVASGGSVQGTVAIDTTGFDDFSPALAFGTGSYLVAYEEATSTENHDIFGAFVSP